MALVDREKCTGCGACAKACPNAIISIIPEHKRKPVVLCQNKDKGAQTRKACSAGCIGCMKCAKACPKQAITVENNLAYIDQEKCVGCGLCAKECPVGVIHVPAAYAQQVMSPPGGGPRGQTPDRLRGKKRDGTPVSLFLLKRRGSPPDRPGPAPEGPRAPIVKAMSLLRMASRARPGVSWSCSISP